MRKLTIDELTKEYEKLEQEWERQLKGFGIKLPKLKKGEKYIIDALVLIYFHMNFKKIVTKQELTFFIQHYKPEINDVQQGRHLSQQKGWYIISGQRGDEKCKELGVKPGEYMFYSLDEIYPGYTLNRKSTLSNGDFEEIKNIYNSRCATCGSKEGEENFLYRGSITKLEKGHMNPLKDLTPDNTIPQCDKCNKAYRNYFEFDRKGRVRSITDPKVVLKSDIKIQKEIYEILKKIDSN